MIASRRAGEITFYEELGVSSAASSQEIRDSFRTLARLLHPDQQTDPHLKDVAEKQMRKLNRIYAVLSDPDIGAATIRMSNRDTGHRSLSRAGAAFSAAVGRGPDRMGRHLLCIAGLTIWFATETITASLRPVDQTADTSPQHGVTDRRTPSYVDQGSELPVAG